MFGTADSINVVNYCCFQWQFDLQMLVSKRMIGLHVGVCEAVWALGFLGVAKSPSPKFSSAK